METVANAAKSREVSERVGMNPAHPVFSRSLVSTALFASAGIVLYAAYVNTILRPPRFDEAYLLLMNRHAAMYSKLLALVRDGAVETPTHPLAVMFLTRTLSQVNDLIVTREFSTACMAVSILVVFSFLKNNFGTFTAAIGCLMFAASEFFWFAASDGRNYALATLLAMVAVWSWDKGKPIWDVLSMLTMLLGLFTHYFFVFAIAACGVSLIRRSDVAVSAGEYRDWRLLRVALIATVLTIFIVVSWPNVAESIRARAGATGIWNEKLSVWRLIEYSVGLPWIPKAEKIASASLLCLFVAALVFAVARARRSNTLKLTFTALLLSRKGLLLLMLCLPGLGVFVLSNLFQPFDFVARYFFVSALGANLLIATIIGQLWEQAIKRRIHYLLLGTTLLCLIARIYSPTLGYSQMRQFEAHFSSQMQKLDSLARQELLLFDVSDFGFRFFWQVCWASPVMESKATGIVDAPGSGPLFLTAYYKHFSTPRFVALRDVRSVYDTAVLVTSNPNRALGTSFEKLPIEPPIPLGEITGGLVVAAYRVASIRDSRRLQ